MSKKILVSLLLCITALTAKSQKACWEDLPRSIRKELNITGPAPEFYEKHARRLLVRFNLKDPFSIYLVQTGMKGCGGFACWCDENMWGQVVMGKRYKILALETAWIQNLAYGSKMMLLAHEISHMVDFQRFGIQKFYQARTDFCSRVVEEHADKMALVMVSCSECMKEQGDLWKLLADQYRIPEETIDTEGGSHPNLIRRAKYHYAMAQAYEGCFCDHHLMAQYEENDKDYTGLKSKFYASHAVPQYTLDVLYQRFVKGEACCQKVASKLKFK